MKLVVQKQDINKVMQTSQNIVEKKSTMPILQNALLDAKGDTLIVSSSDMEITLISKVKATVLEEGSTTVNAKVFSDIIKELPEEDVLLELGDGEILSITSAKASLKILCISSESFPCFPTNEIEAKYKIQASVLLGMFNSTSFAVSNDETRWSLNGVCLKRIKQESSESEDFINAVATDGHRLAIATREIDIPCLKDEVIIPKKGVFELKKILEELGDEEILFDITDSLIVVETKNQKIGIRLIDAKYPDYTYAIPHGDSVKIELNTNVIINSLRRMSLMNSEKDKKMIFHFENNCLVMTSNNPGIGEAKDEIEVNYQDEPLDLGFNPKYLLDLVSNIGDETIIFEVYGKLKPMKIYSKNDESSIAYLMPMRVISN